MQVFKELFGELFKELESDKFLGVVRGENLGKLEERIEFREGENLGAGKKKRRPYIAVKFNGSTYKVYFLTTLFAGSISINLREKCLINEDSYYCKNLNDVCFTYKYAYLISELTLKKFSEICGKCFDLEELESIPLGGGEIWRT